MSRAASPAVGVLLLTAVTLVLAASVSIAAVDLVPGTPPARPVSLSASAEAATGRLALTHEGGPTLDVRRLRVRVSVDGTRLRHQPPVPFAGAAGFRGAPSGPFNRAADPRWEVGEVAALTLAGTNEPAMAPGALVRVEIARGETVVATVEVRAG